MFVHRKLKMSLTLHIEQNITCEQVVQIAERAAQAILDVYNSKVNRVMPVFHRK